MSLGAQGHATPPLRMRGRSLTMSMSIESSDCNLCKRVHAVINDASLTTGVSGMEVIARLPSVPIAGRSSLPPSPRHACAPEVVVAGYGSPQGPRYEREGACVAGAAAAGDFGQHSVRENIQCCCALLLHCGNIIVSENCHVGLHTWEAGAPTGAGRQCRCDEPRDAWCVSSIGGRSRRGTSAGLD